MVERFSSVREALGSLATLPGLFFILVIQCFYVTQLLITFDYKMSLRNVCPQMVFGKRKMKKVCRSVLASPHSVKVLPPHCDFVVVPRT